jgi:peptidoglycan/xylan/chitin deacetylase (PgdA/CDA1 family)
MIRLQTILLVLVVIAVIIWGAHSVSSDDPDATPAPTPDQIAFDVVSSPTSTPTATPPPTRTPEPTAIPTKAPRPTATTEPTPEPTAEPVATERPAPPDFNSPDEAVVIDRGDSGRPEIAFTFDAGEGAGHTAEILDLLDAHGIKGTFGMTGQWAEANPELVQRIVDEGHMIINHTYDHKSFTGYSPGADPLTAEQRAEEVQKTEQIILDISGYETAPYFRFPYNDYDADSLYQLSGIGFDIVAGYTCDSMAWWGKTAEEILDHCGPDNEDGGPGAVILMHVVQDEDVRALPMLIDLYQSEGYDFVTYEQIIQP